MNRWLQTKTYTCPACGARYLHDKAHHHAVFLCPARRKPVPVAKDRSNVLQEEGGCTCR
jgi:hypothetical protein